MTTAEHSFKYAALGANIRRARKRANISQESLAPLVGTSRRHLIRLENGEHQAGPELARRIANVLEADASEFRLDDDEDEDSEMLRSFELFKALLAQLPSRKPVVA